MDATLADFIRIIRAAGVSVSVSESIDAHQAVRRVGLGQRPLLKSALGATLAKSEEERMLFDGCFERFFAFQELSDERPDDVDLPEQGDRAPDQTDQWTAGAPGAQSAGTGELSDLSQQLLAEDWARVNVDIAAAGQRAGANRIVSFTQRGRFAYEIASDLGQRALNADIARLATGADPERELAARLERARGAWIERIRDYVERQVALFADPEDRRWMRERLPQLKLATVDRYYHREMQDLVRRMARRLVALHMRRRKKARRGQLDFRRTLRKGLAYDGIPFEPQWRRIKKDQPRIMVLCDVSGSVATVAQFLLIFLYSVNEVLPKVRSFAFSDSLHEVTELFDEMPLEQAIALTLDRLGNRSSSYGRSMADFERLCLREIDHRTTVIVLGDARSNYGDPGIATLRKVHERARQVIWLNPEPRVQWGSGDSEMPLLASACHRVKVCNTLKHLEQLVEDLMRLA